MKASVFSLATIAAGAIAQAVPNLPACGSTSCMLPAISATGCGFTDSACLCAKPEFKKALQTCVPSKCTSQADQKTFVDFINGQCAGQPGYPTSIGASVASPGNSQDSQASGSSAPASSASAAGASPPASSAASSAATKAPAAPASTSASAKPAQFTGAAALTGFAQSVVALAVAGLAMVF